MAPLHAAQAPLPATPHAAGVWLPGSWQTSASQQPLVHDAWVHLHCPPWQVSPGPHAGPEPHRHWPASQPSALPAQPTQALAPVPHWLAVGVRHAPAEQQPPAQPTGSHPQTPPTQCRPAAHGPLAPHPQVPSARQVLLATGSQLTHAPPSSPHPATPGATHWPLWQQPEGQLAPVQLQVFPTHCWPGAQAAPVPQRHAPEAQPSARSRLQVLQLWPAVPHAAALWVPASRQTPLAQQPPGQVPTSQPAHWRLAVQPAGHCWQAPPAVPHWAAVSPPWQTPLASQQPEGQLVASHTHEPATQ